MVGYNESGEGSQYKKTLLCISKVNAYGYQKTGRKCWKFFIYARKYLQ